MQSESEASTTYSTATYEDGERDVFESLSRWIRGAPVYNEKHRQFFKSLGVIREIQFQEVSLFEEVTT